jgi:hypothetical protein
MTFFKFFNSNCYNSPPAWREALHTWYVYSLHWVVSYHMGGYPPKDGSYTKVYPHIIPYHTISYHIISYHTNHIIWKFCSVQVIDKNGVRTILERIQRLIAMRMCSAYRTVRTNTLNVITNLIPIDLKIKELSI